MQCVTSHCPGSSGFRYQSAIKCWGNGETQNIAFQTNAIRVYHMQQILHALIPGDEFESKVAVVVWPFIAWVHCSSVQYFQEMLHCLYCYILLHLYWLLAVFLKAAITQIPPEQWEQDADIPLWHDGELHVLIAAIDVVNHGWGIQTWQRSHFSEGCLPSTQGNTQKKSPLLPYMDAHNALVPSFRSAWHSLFGGLIPAKFTRLYKLTFFYSKLWFMIII